MQRVIDFSFNFLTGRSYGCDYYYSISHITLFFITIFFLFFLFLLEGQTVYYIYKSFLKR